eukprot:Gb_38387 [translate_table: standard]
MKQSFDDRCEISLEDWSWYLRDDSGLDKIRCFILPCLIEGYIVGLSKLLPQDEEFQESKHLWLHKYGLDLPKECFYIRVRFTSGEDIFKIWFPSSLVLKGSGLMPVAQTIRASKVVCALDHFRRSIAGWNFFDGGTPKFQYWKACDKMVLASRFLVASTTGVREVNPLGATDHINSAPEVCRWITAKDALQLPVFSESHQENICRSDDMALCSLTTVFSSLDFRRPKPVSATESRNEDVEHLGERNMKQLCTDSPTPSTVSVNPSKIIPHFIKRVAVQRHNASTDKIAEPVKHLSQMIPTKGNECLLKLPSFVRRKPCNGNPESKHTSLGSTSKDCLLPTVPHKTVYPNCLSPAPGAKSFKEAVIWDKYQGDSSWATSKSKYSAKRWFSQ